ncbi:hypothetical protein FHS61_001983 [Altererythrobacter atlanticus]|uniref:Peptidase family M48 n=2 Tax=Croceibacterium atlanticum TaxID=1267766 RepID=A0A0F7KRX6_9SPHN|nr:M48 family metalloprotease [Croceibacterium atlanticum]AKH41495.1 Peptidase family M48 [Croceibacterium atlanticum]MBB5732957.1 hypothetical protein [Croceibacterium atlanticum]
MVFALASATFSQQALAQSPQEITAIDALRTQDVRLAAIADQMLSANDALCRDHMPITGMILHSRDQYGGADTGNAFAGGDLAVSTTVPGSPAAEVLRDNDAIIAIGSELVADLEPEEDAPLRDAGFDALARQPADAPVNLRIARDGETMQISVPGSSGCRALVEIRARNNLAARSNGRVIQVNYGLAEDADDEQLAIIFAHEMAHLVLEHRRRLSSAGVDKGFFGEFGRNQKYNRQVEVEADRMSVHLLANAGYDPAIAPAFWRSELGGRLGGGLLKISATYPPPESRAQIMEREIADYLGAGAAPSWPGHMLPRRDEEF